MPRFEIHPTVHAIFPDLQVHAVRCSNAGAVVAALDPAALLERTAAHRAADGQDHTATVQAWREAYSRMGATPSRYQSSIESLLRRVAKDDSIAIGVPLVDFYNAHSLRAVAAVGAYDMARLPPDTMWLRPCDPQRDEFAPLGASPDRYPLLPRLFVYASGKQILCWGLNHRDSAHTALDAKSDDVVFFSEAAFAEQQSACAMAIDGIREALVQAGGVCSEHLVARVGARAFEL